MSSSSTLSTDADQIAWTCDYTPQSLVRKPIPLLVNVFESLWTSRGLALRLFLRNIQSIYRQTLLGFLWILVPTVALIGTWYFLSANKIFQDPSAIEGSAFAFIAFGSVLWQSFATSLQAPLRSVLANQSILTRINFPRESLVLVAFAEVLFELVIRLTLVSLVAAWFGISWSPWTLMSLVMVLALILLGLTFGILLTPIGVLYQDMSRLLMLVAPFWMVISPVLYLSPDNILFDWWNALNPPAGMLMVARDLLTSGHSESWTLAVPWLLISLPLFVVGLIWYRLSFPIVIERLAN